ncbi:DUF4412 domain-containing protein [Aureitalea sp. L0-47]|uniref:DUF4412 domain-containing protein n=1 Tax=Aureitalea sp. L0-47 TaxID=2816962 RepID=UPI002237A5D3|nr:DUF4412 domain-containing protein [Aureitalea sp. L0-47]MCW5520718.1 DUF4412 domain-containing protein [Aureitalea sp. L0-47]
MIRLKNMVLLLVALMMFSTTSRAQKSFEGRVVYTIELAGEGADQMAAFMPNNYEYVFKGKKLKFKMNGGMTAAMMGDIIVDGEMEKAWMVKHEEQTAYTFPDNDEEEETPTPTITKEDEIIAISGYECQKYKVVTQAENGEESTQYLWVTDKFKIERTGGSKDLNAGAFFLEEINGMPLKIMIENMGMTMIMTATTIDTKKVSDSEFDIPEDYEEKEFDPSAFGGGQ